LTPEGGRKFADFTRRNTGAALAVVLDGKILSAPVVNEPILEGRAVIQGDFNMGSAGRFAALLNSGSLPAPLEIVSVERTRWVSAMSHVRRSTVSVERRFRTEQERA